MRPILSATKTYNCALAKGLDDKLKPLAANKYTIADTFEFVNEVHDLKINSGDFLVSYDVSSLFTNVPLDDLISILADKAFTNDWFNETHGLHLTKQDLVDFLRVATKDQLFLFNGQLYEQTDGAAMGSPLGPLLANVFVGSIEETLERKGKMPTYYRRYVDSSIGKGGMGASLTSVHCLSTIFSMPVIDIERVSETFCHFSYFANFFSILIIYIYPNYSLSSLVRDVGNYMKYL